MRAITLVATVVCGLIPQAVQADFVALPAEPGEKNHEPALPAFVDTDPCEPNQVIFYVSTAGDDDAGDGSKENPWRTIQKALDEGGSCIVVPGNGESGAFQENVKSVNHGTAANPITVRCEGANAGWSKPPLDPGDEGYREPLFTISHDYHRIIGCDLNMNSTAGYAIHIIGADHTIVAGNFIRGVRDCDGKPGGSGGIHISQAEGVYILDNVIADNFKDYQQDTSTCPTLDLKQPSAAQCAHMTSHHEATSDADGIRIEDGASRVWIDRNTIYNNSGDGVQVNGDPNNATEDPHDISLIDNEIYTTSSCRGWTENAVDLKSCSKVRLSSSEPATKEADAFRQHFYDFYPTWFAEATQSQGEGVVVHAGTTEITIEKTRISNVCRGIAAGQKNIPVTDMSIRRLWIAQNANGQMASSVAAAAPPCNSATWRTWKSTTTRSRTTSIVAWC